SFRNLQDRDTLSKSDPICVVLTRDIRSGNYHEFGRTEMIKDTLNPDFVKKFNMKYFFEESQKLRFEIYDVDSPSQKLESHDFLGRIDCTLGEIVGASSGKMERKLEYEIVTLHFSATKLDKKDFLGKSDPFLIFYRANEDRSYTVTHKTEVIKNTLNPTWRPFTVPVKTLCNGDYNRSIKVECFDWDSDGSSHDLIGEFTTNLQELSKGSHATFDVINPKKKAKKKSYKNSGQVQLMKCKVEIQPSFLDYLKGGYVLTIKKLELHRTQLNFTVAIDFTASNGNPSNSNSLHYISPYGPNQYVMAIQAVGEIIQDYDSDKLFPVLGFGAKLQDGSVSHEFPLTFNPQNPYCQGIQGVLQAYYASIQRVQLYGPTNFSPVINHVARFASSMRDGSNYFVLLILTDGVITDLPQTIEAIVQASNLPMSIIIVGVGNAEFDAMNVLDADERRLSSNGKYAVRDIVQFVPFREFLGGGGGNSNIAQAALAKEVLAEIPDQIIQYMKANNIAPKPPKANVNVPGNNPNQGVQGPGPNQGGPVGQIPPQGQNVGGPASSWAPQQQGTTPYPGSGPTAPQGNAPTYPGSAPSAPHGSAPPYPGGSGSSPYPAQTNQSWGGMPPPPNVQR
ncbi:hypothetical protein FSP39_000607, partial [Pinctada imbricata]